MKEVIGIKLGGSIITDKDQERKADLGRIEQLTQEIHRARTQSNKLLVLGHGAGSFGHPQAKKYRTKEGLSDQASLLGLAEVRQAVTELNAIVVGELIQVGEPAVAFSPFSFLVSDNFKIDKFFFDPLKIMLDFKLLPVIHGDVIGDSTSGSTILSGEQLLNLIAQNLPNLGYKPDFIIEVGRSEGVEDRENHRVIEVINSKNYSAVERLLGESNSVDVTGGMAHKVKEAFQLAKFGIPTLLISAQAGNLEKAILGQKVKGTWIRND